MDIDLDNLKDKEEIIRDLVEHVVKTDEEVEDKETRGGKTTDLKLYLLDNKGFKIGQLDQTIEFLSTSDLTDKNAKNWIAEHVVDENTVSDDISLVKISTPSANRTDDFVFIQNNGYLWILTTERKEWAEKTVENLIKYLPNVERLYLDSEALEDTVEGLEDAYVSGFTAKYHSPNRARDATLVFHGAEEDDLDKAEEAFQAKPTRIEFDQANSPAAAIQGSQANDGELSLESVRGGSEPKAVATLIGLSEEYQTRDRETYEVEHPPERTVLDDGSCSVNGFTAVELTDPDRDSAPNLPAELEEEIFSGHQYEIGHWGEDTVFVHDTEHQEIFEVALEPPNIILYARESTSALSLRSFCQEIIDEFDSTYSIQKRQNTIAGQ